MTRPFLFHCLLCALLGAGLPVQASGRGGKYLYSTGRGMAYTKEYLDRLKGRRISLNEAGLALKIKISNWRFDRALGILVRTDRGQTFNLRDFEPLKRHQGSHIVENKTTTGQTINDWIVELQETWQAPLIVGRYDSIRRAAARIYPMVARSLSDKKTLVRLKGYLYEVYRNLLYEPEVAAADEDFALNVVFSAGGGTWSYGKAELELAIAELLPHARLHRKRMFDLSLSTETLDRSYTQLWDRALSLLDRLHDGGELPNRL